MDPAFATGIGKDQGHAWCHEVGRKTPCIHLLESGVMIGRGISCHSPVSSLVSVWAVADVELLVVVAIGLVAGFAAPLPVHATRITAAIEMGRQRITIC